MLFLLGLLRVAELLNDGASPSHDSLVRLSVALVVIVQPKNAVGDIHSLSDLALQVLLLPKVVVLVEVHRHIVCVVSTQHVLRMVVHHVNLLGCQRKLRYETRNSEFIDDLQDVEFLVQPGARLPLQLVHVLFAASVAAAPRRRKVFHCEEPRQGIAEGASLLACLDDQVVLELVRVLRHVRFAHTFALSLVGVAVEFLGERIVEGESLVCTQDVADDAQHEEYEAAKSPDRVCERLSD